MKAKVHPPRIIALFAAIGGAIAWGAPPLLLPLIPSYPPYSPSPGLEVHFLELVLSYSLAAAVGGGVFLLGSLAVGRRWQPLVSRIPVLPLLAGLAVGGALAAAIAVGIGYSIPVEVFMTFFGLQDRLPEPMLSIGLIMGAGVSALMIVSLVDVPERLHLAATSRLRGPFALPMIAACAALGGRVLAGFIDLLSFPPILIFGSTPTVLFLDSIAGGALYGYLVYFAYSRLKAA